MIPRKIRLTYISVRVRIQVEPRVTTPNDRTRKDSQMEPTFLITRFEGESAKMYCESGSVSIRLEIRPSIESTYRDKEEGKCDIEIIW